LLGTLAYTFARIGAVVNLKVEDCFQTVKRSMIRFREKDGKETVLPVNHKLEELLHRYLEISGLKNRSNAPLFPIALDKTRKLGNRPATRIDTARMLKRRLKEGFHRIIRPFTCPFVISRPHPAVTLERRAWAVGCGVENARAMTGRVGGIAG
jgi:integrase